MMTRDEILSMPAGRELDALIAKAIFNLDPQEHDEPCYEEKNFPDGDGYSGFYCPRCGISDGSYYSNPCTPAKYSENIATAWQVVEHFKYWSVHKAMSGLDNKTFYTCTVWNDYIYHHAKADTPELAISRAALLAVLT